MMWSICIGIALAVGTYAPQEVQCPASLMLRDTRAGNLCGEESQWVQQRDLYSQPEMIDWLEDSNLRGIDVRSYLGSNMTRIGMAFSGGGFRAMLSGAGMVAALDKRTSGSQYKTGGLGGLLQASTYVSGLSGGSWLIGSLAVSNWTSIPDLQASKDLWNFQNPFTPGDYDKSSVLSAIRPRWDVSIVTDVISKVNAGFQVSIADIWGRLLSAQLFAGPQHGRTSLWSDLVNNDLHYSMPLPIIICDSYNTSMPIGEIKNSTDKTKTTIFNASVSLNSTVFEITPFEFGSWDPTVLTFVSTKYLGTQLDNEISNSMGCYSGYDNVGFLVGASSTVFNAVIQQVFSVGVLKTLYNYILGMMGEAQNIIYALIDPNPFLGVPWATESVRDNNILRLVDGGEDDQNIPLDPLIRPERNLDLILSFDNSADTSQNWPSGASMWNTYQRQLSRQGNSVPFPTVPKPEIFVKLGINKRPTLFGCNNASSGPLILYVPNSYKSYSANQDTFKLSYSAHERDETITNGYNVMTQNNGTIDSEWRACIACSIILRQQQRNGDEPTEQCKECFQRYCYTPKT